MEKSTLQPWDTWTKYKLVASPSTEAAVRLEEARSAFKMLHPNDGLFPTLELSFFNHRLPESSESLLLSWLFNFMCSQSSFPVLINNISGIPPHQVQARIQATPQHAAFEQKLVALLSQLSGITASRIQYTQQCRLALITELPGVVFHRAMQFFSGIDLYTSIEVQQLELLKMLPTGNWKLLQRFQLAPMPAVQQQPWFQTI
ncbi:MAG TPA: hypothetical protein VLC98_15985 [Phnomibacter sp.]|nr:hypothetical protein [Phnomibacter sp.]